jgi:hypothetical protein
MWVVSGVAVLDHDCSTRDLGFRPDHGSAITNGYTLRFRNDDAVYLDTGTYEEIMEVDRILRGVRIIKKFSIYDTNSINSKAS